jgi:hypothetical protein
VGLFDVGPRFADIDGDGRGKSLVLVVLVPFWLILSKLIISVCKKMGGLQVYSIPRPACKTWDRSKAARGWTELTTNLPTWTVTVEPITFGLTSSLASKFILVPVYSQVVARDCPYLHTERLLMTNKRQDLAQ